MAKGNSLVMSPEQGCVHGGEEKRCAACGTGTYTAREAATFSMTCEPGKYSSGGGDICTSFVATGTSECCVVVDQLGNEVKSLKHEVESLKQLVTPRSSFIPTGNRTMPTWGNSVHTRCHLSFSWTELNKVRSFFRYYPIVPPYFFCLSDVFHYIRGTKSVKLFSGLEVSVDICRKLCTRAGSVWTTFAVIPSSAGSIMRSKRCLHHGEQTVISFLLQDCKRPYKENDLFEVNDFDKVVDKNR